MSADPQRTAVSWLASFRDAGILAPSDVHVAATLARLGRVDRPDVVLAAALAARAPRYGHAGVDLATIASLALDEVGTDERHRTPPDPSADVSRAHEPVELRWPEPQGWQQAVAASPLVATTTAANRPLVLHAGLLYLHRARVYEEVVAQHLLARATAERTHRGVTDLRMIDELLAGDGAEVQRAAVRASVGSPLSVVVGGPGTGKTTTVAALLAGLTTDRGMATALKVALAAPTGKAAARMGEAFAAMSERMPAALTALLHEAEPTTIHRLLGARPGRGYLHHRRHPLPHDVVIVDECSMVSLPLMARLLDALRPTTQLVLVGDPGQLTSVGAGTVLADVVGPSDAPGPLTASISVLTHSRRFPDGSPLDRLARAVRAGDADAALEVLAGADSAGTGHGAVSWIAAPGDDTAAVAAVREIVMPHVAEVARRARAGEVEAALASLEQCRLLCAHRHGRFGVGWWNHAIERWLDVSGLRTRGWYPGRPVMVTANDDRNRVSNGDLGVVVDADAGPVVVLGRAGNVRMFAPSRLAGLDTVHAMTVHKSQGSEFDHVVVVLPPATSPLATRELLYTAITRARRRVTVVGDESAIRAAVERLVRRSGNLHRDLWPDVGTAGVETAG